MTINSPKCNQNTRAKVIFLSILSNYNRIEKPPMQVFADLHIFSHILKLVHSFSHRYLSELPQGDRIAD